MKESRACHTCQRHSLNFMTATCGHKICFHCVKGNRNSHKCSVCIASQPKSRSFLSPSRNVSQEKKDHKQKSTKMKDSDSKLHSDFSPTPINKSKAHAHRSNIKNERQEDEEMMLSGKSTLICKQHQEPLTMYCRSMKELMCSICLCSKSKYYDVMPLKLAEETLRKENKYNREESKNILSNIENAEKVMFKNVELFKQSYEEAFNSVGSFFDEIKKEVEVAESHAKQKLGVFFERKMKECQEIMGDLAYLNQILKEFKESNKENCTFNESIYLFSSFKVIKGTIKNLDLDYISYSKQPNLIEHIKLTTIKDNIRNSIQFYLELPLKEGQRRKMKSNSRSVSRSRNEEWDDPHINRQNAGKVSKQKGGVIKKHQKSLCSNIHGIQICQQQRNLYKMLLKIKFKL